MLKPQPAVVPLRRCRLLYNDLFQYLAYRCYMAAFRLPEGDMPIPCCVFKRSSEQCKRCKQVFGSSEELMTGFCEQGGHHVHTDERIQESLTFIQQYFGIYNPTADDILRERIQEFSKRHQEYIQFCQHKFGFVSAEDELGQIWPSDDGDDAVTTTTIGQPTPEVHKTATARVITITRM